MPRPCRRALDAGCGTGAFARRLAAVADGVDAIDCDADVLARARALGGPVRYAQADFLGWTGAYDFIALIATLHHLPFARALAHARELLAPGGVLAVLGLDRAPSLPDRLAQAAVDAPLRAPVMTLREIRAEAAPILPGMVLRRHLLWRYSLIGRSPAH